MATSQASLVEQVIARCGERRFTGLLRVRTLEGKGELSFLSGIRDTVVFDASDGEEALQRLFRSTRQEFEAIPRLPPIDAHSEQPLAEAGELGKLRPVNLLRYCESQSITCTLDLYVAGKSVRLAYEVGELLGVEPETADISGLLESKVGSYRINLPSFELPEAARPRVAPPAVQAAAPVRRPSAQDVGVVQPALAAASSARMAAVAQHKPSASTAALAAAQGGAGALRADKPRSLGDVAVQPLAPIALGGGSSATLPAARPARVDATAPSSSGNKARPPALPGEPPRGPELRVEVESTPRSGGVATPKARPPALPPEVAQSRPPSVVVAPDSVRPQHKGPPPLDAVATAAQPKERPEFMTVTKPSKRLEPTEAPRPSGSLEPWSPASTRFDEKEARQSSRPPARQSGSRSSVWVLLALVVLVALAYFFVGLE